MGEPSAQQQDDKAPEEVNVIVTGGGPWGEGTPWQPIPVNASWLIADALPRLIHRGNDPVPSSWVKVREIVPKLWDGEKGFFRMHRDPKEPTQFPVTAVLHMGMLDQPKENFRLERYGFKKGYDLPDVDGKHPDHDDLTGGGTWENVPDKVATDIDIDKVLEKVKSSVKDANVVISHNLYPFMCGYEYFNSLARLYNEKQTKRVIFMHTPIEHSSEAIHHGVQIAVNVLKTIVKDMESRAD